MFAIQRFNGPGWAAVTRNPRSLVAYAFIGKLKTERDKRPIRVVKEATGNVAPPPEVGYLVAWMWLRGFSEVAIDRACEHIREMEEDVPCAA